MALHNALTGAELHEPKGAAAASDGMVYVADGAGSGVWQYSPTGQGLYVSTNIQTFTTTPTKFICNGLGAATEEAYLPREIRGIRGLWNVASNKVNPIAVGDAYLIRVDFTIAAKTASPERLEFIFDIGNTGSPTIALTTKDLILTKTTPFRLSTSFGVTCDATFLANGGQIFISTDVGTVDVTDTDIEIIRIHGEV